MSTIKHDINERVRADVLKMREKYGDRGYGWLWIIREVLAQAPGGRLTTKHTSILVINTDADEEMFISFLDDCIHEFHLLKCDAKSIWCPETIRSINKNSVLTLVGRIGVATRHGKDKEAVMMLRRRMDAINYLNTKLDDIEDYTEIEEIMAGDPSMKELEKAVMRASKKGIAGKKQINYKIKKMVETKGRG